MATNFQITIDQGADYYGRFDTGVDLTGYLGASVIKDTYGGTTVGTFVVTPNGTAGTVDLFMDAVDTGAIAAGVYVYDVRLANATSGDEQRIAQGTVTVSPRVT